MLRIHELKERASFLSQYEEGEKRRCALKGLVLKKLGVKGLSVTELRIVKESIDARSKQDIRLVYTLEFSVEMPGRDQGELESWLVLHRKKIRLETCPKLDYNREAEIAFPPVRENGQLLSGRPVIVGFGPCGMFAGLLLAQLGYRPIILERGKAMEERVADVERFWQEGILCEESNVQFGEGGAGTFSDGKLTTQIRDVRVRKILWELAKAGGGEEILYRQKPHIGTDVLRGVVVSIREQICALGGEIHFQTKLTGLEWKETEGKRQLTAALAELGQQRFETSAVVLALGHSARDTVRILHEQGVEMIQKPFSIGVRIEHPQSMVNLAQLGPDYESLGLTAADYKLSSRCENGRGVYTFCMCPGGVVVGAASQKGGVVTNGMSNRARDGKNANSALLVDVRPEDFGSSDPLAGIAFQEKYERLAFLAGEESYRAPAQRLDEFMGWERGDQEAVSPTCSPGVTFTQLDRCLPKFAAEAMREAIPKLGRKLLGFDRGDAVMTGVETRSSSPVRLLRGDTLESLSMEGLYPGGEGAGYAGGIVSAAVDGIRIAQAIAAKYLPAKAISK